MQTRAEDRSARWRRLTISLLVGAGVGFAGASLLTNTIRAGVLGTLDVSQVAALGVAMVYLLMGVAVGLGAASPRVGATFLNVADADELREERASILPSGISCVAIAAGLAALALSGPAGLIAPSTALAVFGGTLIVATWLSVGVMRRADELMRQVMSDGAAVSFYLAFFVLGGWAVLAHLGFAAGPAMLDVVSLFYALTLVGSFWVIGRRGMLMR